MSQSDNQMRPDIEQAKNRMATKFGGKRELRKLQEHVWPGEIVERMATGAYGGGHGLLVMTDKRLIFLKEEMLSSTLEDFPFDMITSIQWSTGMISGKIQVFLSVNMGEITHVDKTDGKAIAEAVRARISNLTVSHPAARPPSTPPPPEPPVAQSPLELMQQLEQRLELMQQLEQPLELMKQLEQMKDAGWISEGSHIHPADFSIRVIDYAISRGFEIDEERYRADIEWMKSEENDEDRTLDIQDALDWTCDDALDYLNGIDNAAD